MAMKIPFARHQFPPVIIRHAVWLYLRFTLSFRDVEDLLAERGLDVSYETVRRWVLKFGPLFAKELRRRRHRPTSHWHLDEMASSDRRQAILALASGRRRRRGSRSAGATATRQDCSGN
jgi:transposase-like protein